MKQTHLYSTLSSLVLILITLSLLFFYQDISNFSMATCMPNECFCEAINHKCFIKQFSNTFSSFSFVYLGFYIFFENRTKKLFQIFGIFTLSIGFGSAFFHGSLSFLGQTFDLAGIYLLTSFIFVYALFRKHKLSITTAIVLLIVINIILDIVLIYFPEFRRYLVAIIIIVGLSNEVLYAKKEIVNVEIKWINYAIISILTAFSMWILDMKKIFCFPESIFQGHALWHLLATLSVYFLYRYYRSEKL